MEGSSTQAQVSGCPGQLSSRILRIFLAGYCGAVLFTLKGSFAEFSMLSATLDGVEPTLAQTRALEDQQELQLYVLLGVGLCCMLSFLVFYGRTIGLPKRLGIEGTRATPTGAVVSFFVPFVALYKPLVALQEAWKALAPNAGKDDWQDGPESTLITVWWCVWLAGFVASFSMRWHLEIELFSASLRDQLIYVCLAKAFYIASTITTMFMVRAVALRSLEKWQIAHGTVAMPRAELR